MKPSQPLADEDDNSLTWKQKYLEILKEYEKLKAKQSKGKSQYRPRRDDYEQFWMGIEDKLIDDPDAVKQMIKTKELSLEETNPDGRTILVLAASYGSYEVCQLCINSGADLHAKDNVGDTALDLAHSRAYYNVEQLLLFAQMNVSASNQIKGTSEVMIKQKGINDNILKELSVIGATSKELFEKILMEIMINIVKKRAVYSDALFNLCWSILTRDGKDPLKSELWMAMKNECNVITQIGTKRDWFWIKHVVIPSTIWWREITVSAENEEYKNEENAVAKTGSNKQYLYFELLKLVDMEAQNQTVQLDKDLKQLADENKEDWENLITFQIPDQYETCRQDVIPNGIVSQYTYSQLLESSGATFNSPKFYDYNQYLSQLVLLAQIVDDEFQKSCQDIFGIDKVTAEGTISFSSGEDTKMDDDVSVASVGDGRVTYMRGPVKLIERAKAKAQNDYADEDYPASACVLDMNRCCFVFNDISTLLLAVKMFVNKVTYYQSGNIIGISRCKNGFIEYIQDGAQYADIKLNVLIRGTHNNIVGEVQFLLKTMKEYKDKAHNLYMIQRKRESIENSVKILPKLLNEKTRLFVAGITGSVQDLCKLMVISNMSNNDIIQLDPDTGNTILHRMCRMDNHKALMFLQTIVPKETLVKNIFHEHTRNTRPIEYAIWFRSRAVVRILFNMQEVVDKFKDDDTLFRLLYRLFAFNKNEDLIDYILHKLNVDSKRLIKMLNHKSIAPKKTGYFKPVAYRYHRYKLIHGIVQHNTLKGLNKLIAYIGEKAFIQNIFKMDDWNVNVIEKAVFFGRQKIVEYVLSFKEVRERYKSNDKLAWRLLYILFSRNGNPVIRQYVLEQFEDLKSKFIKLIGQRFPGSDNQYSASVQEAKFASNTFWPIFFYENYSICSDIVKYQNISAFKELLIFGGEECICNGVLIKDRTGTNAIQTGIQQNKFEMIEYLLKLKKIKEKCSNDERELWIILKQLSVNYDEEMAKYITQQLNVNRSKLNEMKRFKEFDASQIMNIL